MKKSDNRRRKCNALFALAAAAAFLMSASPAFATSHLPFAVGEARDVGGGVCFEDGHNELLEALEEDVNEGKETEEWRIDTAWREQVAAGQCWRISGWVSLKVAGIEGPFKTIYGPSYSIRYESDPSVFIIWLYVKPENKPRGVAI